MSERAEGTGPHERPRSRARRAEEEETGASVRLARPRLLPLDAAERAAAVRLLASLIRAACSGKARSPEPAATLPLADRDTGKQATGESPGDAA